MIEQSVDALLDWIRPGADPTRVLDVGCGKGEILVRALARLGGTGLGLEPNPAFAADARARANDRLAPDTVRILEVRFEDADLPDRAFTLGICTGSLHAFGDWRAALDGMARLVTPDGWALLGPGYWKRLPAPEYLAALGGREDEMLSLPGTLAMAGAAGWSVHACHESSTSDWDAYEHAYAARMHEWCDAHPRDIDAVPFRQRIESWAAAYRRWGRDTMGCALLLLRRG